MNMMTVKEDREPPSTPNATPDHPAELAAGYPAHGDDPDSDEHAPRADQERGFVARRLRWIRDQRMATKINAIFACFTIVGLAVVLITAFGLTELYLRYTVANDVQRATVMSSNLQATVGELRYNSARYLFEQEAEVFDRQREVFARGQEQLNEVEAKLREHAPEMLDRVDGLRQGFKAYDAAFQATMAAQTGPGLNPKAEQSALKTSERGDALFAAAGKFAADTSNLSEKMREARVDYLFTMVRGVVGLALIAALVLVAGFSLLSRDLARKIREITQGMTRLASGDRGFEIKGQDRKDEIGEMLRALTLFKRANRQLEMWARERSDHAEKEISAQRELAQEREDAGRRRAALIDDFANGFERTVGEVVSKVTSASGELQTTAARMAQTAEQAAGRSSELTDSMAEASSGATAAAAASDEFALSISEISRQASSSSELARLAADATEEADTTIS
ncbi:MAG: methyl-accepting chemotaxis protein, partial [Pseudomonadota bacterium]